MSSAGAAGFAAGMKAAGGPSVNDLNVPMVVEQGTLVADGQGGQTLTWTPMSGTVWGSLKQLVTQARDQAGGIVVISEFRVHLRWESVALTSGFKWRLNTPFGILYVLHFYDLLSNRRWWECRCTEVPI